MNTEKVDLVVVTYESELHLLDLLCRSVQIFAEDFFNKIYVISQGNHSVNKILAIHNIIFPTLNKYKGNVIVLQQRDLIDGYQPRNGWVAQQILKLLACKVVESCHYMVIDCKNHFTKKIKYSDFFVDNKPFANIVSNRHHLGSGMGSSFQACANFFGLNTNEIIDQSFSPTTPFIFIKQEVENFISTIENNTDISFSSFFESSGFTEFYAYFCFLKKTHQNIYNCYAANERPRAITLWGYGLTHIPNYFDDQLKIARKDVCYVFAIHKGAYQLLTDEQKSVIGLFWSELGLIKSNDFIKYLKNY